MTRAMHAMALQRSRQLLWLLALAAALAWWPSGTPAAAPAGAAPAGAAFATAANAAAAPEFPAARGTQTPASPLLRELVGTVVGVRTTAMSGSEAAASLGARRLGSGAILDPTTVLTIGYLLLEVETVEILTESGKTIPASVAGYDHESGLGVVRTAVPLDGTPLQLGDSDGIEASERVLTLGHGEPAATELVVLSRKPFAGGWEYLVDRAIFTFPPVNNWSGAALMSTDGKLIGVGSLIVNDAATDQSGVPGNMFVPVNLIKPILADLLNKGRRDGPAQPWLGLTTENVRGNLMVSRLTRDGPAEQAGLSVGDIIVAVGDKRFADQAEFYRQIRQVGPAGSTIGLRVLHEGMLREVSVRSADRADHLRKPDGI
ncbi:MAG TPA: S1C family serine protease [Burkholderiaceae bacterium]|nr:S1C family serine protease [Burkholderiaceae bacterium]